MPSASVALAMMLIVEPLLKDVLFAGDVMLVTGAIFAIVFTVTLTAAEVVDNNFTSVSLAVKA
ncbi:MAG: hypothetical protein HY305_02720 [Sphingobacteriales bacterium]|nr:hypothetical protein [Sphingobacteriales bacterium]